jgi:hypothetical protein
VVVEADAAWLFKFLLSAEVVDTIRTHLKDMPRHNALLKSLDEISTTPSDFEICKLYYKSNRNDLAHRWIETGGLIPVMTGFVQF